jgi:endonuclease III
VEELLQWRGVEKIERFRRLLELLVEYHIGSVDDLCFWSATSTGRCELLQVKGIGNKTYDYLRMLCGQITFPIDRHIIRFLQMADVDIRSYGYETSQRLLFDSCGRLGADPGVIERGLWALMRSCV